MSKIRFTVKGALTAIALATALPGAAQADINVGVIVSATGTTAALGIPMKNALMFMPEEINGEKVNVVFGDDTSDPSTATNLARRMITQDKVDVIIGSSMTGAAIAIAGVANENGVPQLAMSPINLPQGSDAWTFRMPQQVSLMVAAVVEDMKKKGVKKLGYVGFSDAWGDFWVRDLKTLGEPAGITMVAEERYGRADTSVTGQVLKLVAARPDAILIGASGTASALPQVELRQRGYAGPIYQTHGSVSNDFIRIGGKAVEGTILPAGPVNVAEQLPDTSPVKTPGMEFVAGYEKAHGENSRNQFAGHMYDGIQALKAALPVALKAAKPGTPEFRTAIKDALESGLDIPAGHGVFNFTATDHFGLDERGRVLITVENGKWKLL
ncbi:MAG: branched-chain amino acid ABC transporter substrate-binding protein [Rhodospirillaceae bacterium BRH_c57]|nr:MAG: branched-chain amino acid ABC transporter substrate-binding protein [Rhodospirillaceae bacterium BRH_c57]